MLLFDMMTIGNRLLAARKRLGMTQAEVAERAGLSDRTYADIERGGVNMRIETFLRICQTLAVSPDDILTEERPRWPCGRRSFCGGWLTAARPSRRRLCGFWRCICIPCKGVGRSCPGGRGVVY